MNSHRIVRTDLNSVKRIRSRRGAGWFSIKSTALGITAIAVVAAFFAAIIVPMTFAAIKSSQNTSTTAVTTVTTTTQTSSTSTTPTTSTVSTTTTTPRYPISCFATVTASNFDGSFGTPTQQADGLVDRPNINNGTPFNAGAGPPQWVQLELPGLYNITRIDLLVAQSPNGVTHHQILIGSNSSSLQVITDLTQNTDNYEWLNFTYNPELTNVSFVRVYTLSSPSWVAWYKFTVYDF